MPDSGAKVGLARVSVRSPSLQSVLAEVSADPKVNSVFVKAITPVIRMKIMSMKIKTTPIEPTFINMLKSFLLHM